jgi:hypothetical protein
MAAGASSMPAAPLAGSADAPFRNWRRLSLFTLCSPCVYTERSDKSHEYGRWQLWLVISVLVPSVLCIELPWIESMSQNYAFFAFLNRKIKDIA